MIAQLTEKYNKQNELFIVNIPRGGTMKVR